MKLLRNLVLFVFKRYQWALVLAVTIALFFISYPSDGLAIDMSQEGLSFFYEWYELPIKWLFASLSLVTVINAVNQFQLQREAYRQSIFQNEIRLLQEFFELDSQTHEDISELRTIIFYRRLLEFISTSKRDKLLYRDSTDFKAKVDRFVDEVNLFSQQSISGEFNNDKYISYIDNLCRQVGVLVCIDEKCDAVNSEESLSRIFIFISKYWYDAPEITKKIVNRSKTHHS
ncbi:hypothetical protein [Pseudidiomarina terrestris]|uniref:hypothetical protein n=1 Tax=Pseudidiomarina terrestris TaxID=2820060 RepID=UPI002656A186|nr:hypothetical protein [Pseudidiomarina sp. 1ASP75-5]MDN7136389.1 hypothetical protein [Pseudidiomarina sp. 1ASP75-5]